MAPAEAMAELGNILPRLIYAVGTTPEVKGPVLFSKLDIKDGYWRLMVEEDEDALELCIRLTPSKPTGSH